MASPTKSMLSAAHKVVAEDAQIFIAGCRSMMEDYASGKITEGQVVDGLAKWTEDAQNKKLEQALDHIINPEPVSTDPALFRASLKRKAKDISKTPVLNEAPKNKAVQPAPKAQPNPVSPAGPSNVSESALQKWNKAIINDMRTQIKKKSVHVYYHDTNDIAALTYGTETLFISPAMLTSLRDVIEQKVCDPAESSDRISLGLIQKLLGLTGFLLIQRDREAGYPSQDGWRAGQHNLKLKYKDNRMESLKRLAAHIQFLKGKPFWRIMEATPADIGRLAAEVHGASLQGWLYDGSDDSN